MRALLLLIAGNVARITVSALALSVIMITIAGYGRLLATMVFVAVPFVVLFNVIWITLALVAHGTGAVESPRQRHEESR